MRPYEVMIIFDADLDEEIIRSAVDRSVTLIESRGAERGQIDFWGKRRFAYEVKHRWEGYYVVLQAEGRARGDGRAAPDALPCRRGGPSQGAAHSRAGLRQARGHPAAETPLTRDADDED